MAAASTITRRYVLLTAACLLAFAVTTALHFLGLVSFSNDQYVSLAGAQQMLFGDWPTRDFLDPGLPLAYAASAAAQLLLGRNLFAEAMLTSVAFGLAAALTVVAARRLSGSLVLGIVAAVFEVAVFPRGYSYPKMLLYAAAPLVIWWYSSRPSLLRMAGLAAFLQVAFLFRHDHGAYLGFGAAIAVALASDGTGSYRLLARRLCWFGFFVLAMSLPYLIYVSRYAGLIQYFVRGMAFSAAERAETSLTWPAFGLHEGLQGNSEAFLFYTFVLLPVAAAAVLVSDYRGRGASASTVSGAVPASSMDERSTPFRTAALPVMTMVAPLIAIAIVVNRGFLRDELSTRLADAIVPAVLLAAWLAGRIRGVVPQERRLVIGGIAVVFVLIGAFAVVTVGDTVEQLDRASLFGGLARLPERWRDRSRELHDRFPVRQMPPGPVRLLMPFFHYADRCTTTQHRILLLGFVPEVAVWARRPFAGGRYTIMPGYLAAPDDRRFMMNRLSRETVAFVVVTSRARDLVLAAFPELAKLLTDEFAPLASYPYGEEMNLTTDLFINRTLKSDAVDRATGWPCFQ